MVSMSDNSEIKGNFIFGSGTVGEQMVYRAYVRGISGDISLYTTPSNNAIIRYDDTKQPGIEEYYSAEVGRCWSQELKNSQLRLQKVIFYVPTGSVIEEFKMDLK